MLLWIFGATNFEELLHRQMYVADTFADLYQKFDERLSGLNTYLLTSGKGKI